MAQPFPDMISDNEPNVTKFIAVPKEMSQLSCGAFIGGIVEAVLDGCGFVSVGRTTVGALLLYEMK